MSKDDIPVVHAMPPEDWQANLGKIIRTHYDEDYFIPIVAVDKNDRIMGTAFGIVLGKSIWLGFVIVAEADRRKGIGSAMVSYLIDQGQSRGLQSVQLFATTMGEPVYQKIGFRATSLYHTFEGPKLDIPSEEMPHIRPIDQSDFETVCALDERIMGENRSCLLKQVYPTGWKYVDCKTARIKGVFLPDMDNGMILANDQTAGTTLLRFKHHLSTTPSVIPEENTGAITYLQNQGFRKTKSVPRMIYGQSIKWEAKQLYSRGTAYTG